MIVKEVAHALTVDGRTHRLVHPVVGAQRLPHVLSEQPTVGDAGKPKTLLQGKDGNDRLSGAEFCYKCFARINGDGVLKATAVPVPQPRRVASQAPQHRRVAGWR